MDQFKKASSRGAVLASVSLGLVALVLLALGSCSNPVTNLAEGTSSTSRATGVSVLPLPGVNLGNTLESTWGYAPPTKALIDAMSGAGFKTLRVPCAWSFNSTNGIINSAYMTQVTNVVNWAIADGMHVVINDHWDNGWFERNGFNSYDSAINSKLISLWTQVAKNFKNTSSSLLLFAVANEPDVSTQAQTNVLYQYYQNWINAMRATGGNNATRYFIVQAPGTNIDKAVAYGTAMPTDSARKLMIEVHYYDPYQFTQLTPDAPWGNMFYFWGSGYHVSYQLTNRNATWGDESNISSEFAKMKTNFQDRGYPVYVGEFRATPKPTEPDLSGSYKDQNFRATTYWNKYVENLSASSGFAGTAWIIQNDIFDSTTGAVLDWNQLAALLGNSAYPPISGL